MSSVYVEDIFSMFLGYIKDNELLQATNSVATDLMNEWLKKSYSKPYVRRLFSSLSCDDEVVTYELKHSTDEDADNDFVTDILALGMVIVWLSPIVRSKVNLSQMFTGKNATFFSQASHLDQLRSVLDDAKYEQRKLIQDRGFIYNSYLEES
jgi:hypothetical protein